MQNDVSQPVGVAGHVEVAAEALRAAIHAADDDPGSDAATVGELYRTMGDLALVVDRLPELIRHLARRVERLADIDGLTTDDTTDESGPDTALAAGQWLQSVAFELAAVASGRESPVAEAQQRLAALEVQDNDQ